MGGYLPGRCCVIGEGCGGVSGVRGGCGGRGKAVGFRTGRGGIGSRLKSRHG